MNKLDLNSALGVKILESFEESKNDIIRGLEELSKNYQQDKFLDFETREQVLNAGYVLEAAVYRAIAYKMDTRKTMQPELEKLNSTVNTLAMKANHEFFRNI